MGLVRCCQVHSCSCSVFWGVLLISICFAEHTKPSPSEQEGPRAHGFHLGSGNRRTKPPSCYRGKKKKKISWKGLQNKKKKSVLVHGDLEKNGKQKAEQRNPGRFCREPSVGWGGIWGAPAGCADRQRLAAREASATSTVTLLGMLPVTLHISCKETARGGSKRGEICQAPGYGSLPIPIKRLKRPLFFLLVAF